MHAVGFEKAGVACSLLRGGSWSTQLAFRRQVVRAVCFQRQPVLFAPRRQTVHVPCFGRQVVHAVGFVEAVRAICFEDAGGACWLSPGGSWCMLSASRRQAVQAALEEPPSVQLLWRAAL